MVKKIHYIWLGNNPKSKLIKKCIKSWKKYFPNWEIIEWNESNLDINANKYVKAAYEEKKYAFASDFFRFDVLKKEGGIYLDVDVEVIRPFEDLLKEHKCVMGFEFNKKTINPGLILYVDEPGNSVISELGEKYSERSFFCQTSGIPKTICEYTTEYFVQRGLREDDSFQVVDAVSIFPSTYFCPTNREWSVQNFSAETRCVHHYGSSWLNQKAGLKFTFKKVYCKIFGNKGIAFAKKLLREKNDL